MTPEYIISIVSHGHGAMVQRLLGDLDREPALQGVRVLLTLNLRFEHIDVASFRNLRIEILRNDKPLGFGANHNRAFALCDTPWFIVMNPDLRLAAQQPFDSLLACARQTPKVGVVAPRVVSSAGVVEDSVRLNLTPWSLARRHLLGRRNAAVVSSAGIRMPFHWLAGMCLLCNSAAFRAVGGFDERYFLYCEDYDLCARLYDEGYRLLVDEASEVIHDAQRGSHRSLRYLYWHLSSLLRVWTSRPFWRIVFQTREAGVSR